MAVPSTDARMRFHMSPLCTILLTPSYDDLSNGRGSTCEAVALSPLFISCSATGPCMPSNDVKSVLSTTDLTFS